MQLAEIDISTIIWIAVGLLTLFLRGNKKKQQPAQNQSETEKPYQPQTNEDGQPATPFDELFEQIKEKAAQDGRKVKRVNEPPPTPPTKRPTYTSRPNALDRVPDTTRSQRSVTAKVSVPTDKLKEVTQKIEQQQRDLNQRRRSIEDRAKKLLKENRNQQNIDGPRVISKKFKLNNDNQNSLKRRIKKRLGNPRSLAEAVVLSEVLNRKEF